MLVICTSDSLGGAYRRNDVFYVPDLAKGFAINIVTGWEIQIRDENSRDFANYSEVVSQQVVIDALDAHCLQSTTPQLPQPRTPGN